MNGEYKKALELVLKFVEDNNKQDNDADVANAANLLETGLLDLLD